MAEKKAKKHVSDNAQLMAEWDWEENSQLGCEPHTITYGSTVKVWWVCHEGHKWEASPNNRSTGRGCPYCAKKQRLITKRKTIISRYGSLASNNVDLALQWHPTKNAPLTPEDVSINSNERVWWICSKGHEWNAVIYSRTNGSDCPVCSGHKVVSSINDLATIRPDLAKQWHPTKNGELKPSTVTAGNGKKVWWVCEKEHQWEARIDHRNHGIGCPYCSGRYPIVGENDLQTLNPTLALEWNYEKNKGLTPTKVLPNSDKKIWWRCNKGHEWPATICNRNKGHGCPICNSERHTSFPEYAIVFYLKKHGIDVMHPYRENRYELDIYIPSQKTAIEYDGYYWHKDKKKQDLEKNKECESNGIKLYRIRDGLPSLNSSSIDYIINKQNEDFVDVLKDLLYKIAGVEADIDLTRDSIDIEGLRNYSEKELSLLYINPILSKEWNYEKNGKLKPENFMPNSGKTVWWKCNKEHEWEATIASRNKGNSCPFCSGRNPINGSNDLLTINPSLALEWNYERNAALLPGNVMPNSGKTVWWKCTKGHEWQARIANRNKGIGCPYCSGRYAIKGENDLQTVNPSLAKEWNYEKNNEVRPDSVVPGSNKKVWWKCSNGHEWQAIIRTRNKGTGCPYCSGQRK